MRERLFDRQRRARRPRWTGGAAVEPWPTPDRCPLCGRELHVDRGADQLALFWLHGFGAVHRTTFRTCACGYRRHWTTETISPR